VCRRATAAFRIGGGGAATVAFLPLEVLRDGGVALLERREVQSVWGRAVGHIFSGYKAPPSTLAIDFALCSPKLFQRLSALNVASVTPGAVSSP